MPAPCVAVYSPKEWWWPCFSGSVIALIKIGLSRPKFVSTKPHPAAVSLLAIVQVFATGALAEPAPYTLGVGDRIAVSVHERDDLSGTAQVRAPGVVNLPGLGELSVLGLTTAEVGERMTARLSLKRDADAKRARVEIVEMRPFYVTGDVNAPGAYEFREGLMVMQAVALAGGHKTIDQDNLYVESELARTRERLAQALDSLGVELLRKARLEVEMGLVETLVVPQEAADLLTAVRRQEALAAQQSLLAERTQGLAARIGSRQERKAVFDEEIAAHERQIMAADEQLELIEEEIRTVNTAKGIVVPKTHVLGLRRLAAGIRGERGEHTADIAKAREQQAVLDEEIIQLSADRAMTVQQEVKEVDDAIARLRITIQELTRFLAKLSGTATLADLLRDGAGEMPAAVILRADGDTLRTIAATDTTMVQPGDVLRIPLQFAPQGLARAQGQAAASSRSPSAEPWLHGPVHARSMPTAGGE